MTVQDRPEQEVFDLQAASLLDALLMAPATPCASTADKAGPAGHTNQPFGVDETRSLLQILLEMPMQSRATRSPRFSDTSPLLEMLLETPAPPVYIAKSVALRSIAELRNGVTRYRLRPDWFGMLLSGAQWTLVVVALLTIGAWAAFGPVGNWLYKQHAPTSAMEPARQVATEPVVLVRAKPNPIALSVANAQPRPAAEPDLHEDVSVSQEEFLAQRNRLSTAPLVELSPQPTHLLIPSIGVDTSVMEVFIVDGDWQVAQYAAGYLHGTGLPGDPGNVVIAGHAGFFGGVFAHLGGLATGNDIYVDAAGWRYQYRARELTVVLPAQTEVMLATDIPILTLITCTNWDLQRLVVVADLVGAKPL